MSEFSAISLEFFLFAASFFLVVMAACKVAVTLDYLHRREGDER